jgi:signal peptidase II
LNHQVGDVRAFILISALAAFLDQFSKAMAIVYLIPSKSVPVLGTYLQLTLIRNRGAAFGISLGKNSDSLLLIISAFAVLFIIIYYAKTSPYHKWEHLSFGMITGGAIGNMIDRIAKGEVVDFLDCGIGTLRWPIFNVADIAVTLGAILLIKHSFVYQPRKPRDNKT